jgi:hypothetical protein
MFFLGEYANNYLTFSRYVRTHVLRTIFLPSKAAAWLSLGRELVPSRS